MPNLIVSTPIDDLMQSATPADMRAVVLGSLSASGAFADADKLLIGQGGVFYETTYGALKAAILLAKYPEVANFAALPAAASNTGETYVVLSAQGTYFINRKPSGFYYSDGVNWDFVGELPEDYFTDSILQISDESDPTKICKFQLSGITTGTMRTLAVPDASGTIVLLDAVQTLTNKSIVASQLTGVIADARMPDLTGDVTTVEGAVATTISSGAVSLAKMANLAQDQFIGRTTASTGVPETATITAAARTVLDDTTVGAMATTLGLGTGDSPQFTAVNVGNASDTTLARGAAGQITVEGNNVFTAAKTTATELNAPLFAADAGASDAYAATLSPAIAAYTTGAHYRFKANTANTGACTLALNGLAATTIKKVAGGITTDLANNDIRAGQWVDVVYDGTNFQMQSTLGNAAAGGSSAFIYTLTSSAGLSLGDATVYYYGLTDLWVAATPKKNNLRMPRAGTITRVEFFSSYSAAGTSEAVNHYVRFNDTTDNCNATSTYDSADLTSVAVWTGSQAVAANDYIIIKLLTPTWVTNPTMIYGYAAIYFSPT